MRIVLTGFCVLAMAATAAAETLLVPQEFGTIGEAAAAAGPGDTIVVARGVYFENVTFNATNLTIIGKKAIVDGTVGTVHGDCFTVNGPTSSVQGFTFRNGSTGIQVNGSNCVVKRCRFDSPRGIGINGAGASNTTVSDCVVLAPGNTGILLNGASSATRCAVRQGSGPGIVMNGTGALVEKCTVALLPDAHAIDVAGDDARVLGNRVVGCDFTIRIVGNNAVVERNAVIRAGELLGILVFGDATLVSRNLVSDSRGGGIELHGSSVFVLDNRVSGAREGFGIYVAGAGPTIARNQVRDGNHGSGGIYVSNGATGGGTVEDNLVADCDFDGISVTGAGIEIRRCKVSGTGTTSGTAGFQVDGVGHMISDCVSDRNRTAGFRLSGSSHTLARCSAKANTLYGFVLLSDGGSVIDCIGTGHVGAGIMNQGINVLLTRGTFLGNRQDVTISPFGTPSYAPESAGATFDTGGLLVPSEIWQADD